MYIFQTFLVGGTLLVLLRGESFFLKLQVVAWILMVSGIFLRFGSDGQLNFYSNDQSFYVQVLGQFPLKLKWEDLDYWLTSAKVPYTIPAYVLHQAGLSEALALKTVSLLFLVGLTRRILKYTDSTRFLPTLKCSYLTGCGATGVFFSSLSLRETAMMYFTLRFATDSSGALRILMLTSVYLLRPHLAAALFAAEVLSTAWDKVVLWKKHSFFHFLTLTSIGTVIATNLYYWGVVGFSGFKSPMNSDIGISIVNRIASSFFGLQFLTARQSTREMPIENLLYARILFTESLLIPTVFFFSIILGFARSTSFHRRTLLSFVMFVTISSGTDFLSFRQLLPLYVLLGLSALQLISPSQVKGTSNLDAEVLSSWRESVARVTPRGT